MPAAWYGSAKQNLLTSSFHVAFWGRDDSLSLPLFSVLAASLTSMTGVGGAYPWALCKTPWLPPLEPKCLLWFSWCLSPCHCHCLCPRCQGRCTCRSASSSMRVRESLTQTCVHHLLHLYSSQPQHMDTGGGGLKFSWWQLTPLAALPLSSGCPSSCQLDAPKYITAPILSPCHSSPSHWWEPVLYLPRRVMKIAMTMIVVAWECKELILPE